MSKYLSIVLVFLYALANQTIYLRIINYWENIHYQVWDSGI